MKKISNDTLQEYKGKGLKVINSPAGRSPQSRIAIQTRTEVDVIDDGYKWRKYGQKPVKNSVHPRSCSHLRLFIHLLPQSIFTFISIQFNVND